MQIDEGPGPHIPSEEDVKALPTKETPQPVFIGSRAARLILLKGVSRRVNHRLWSNTASYSCACSYKAMAKMSDRKR